MALTLVTSELRLSDFNLLDHLPPGALSFIRGGQGIVGFGQAVRLESKLPSGRVADLSQQWRKLVSEAKITDDLQLPGTGLVAFGAIAFDDSSAASSVLIVPEIVLGCRDGRVWLTKVENSSAPDFWNQTQHYPTIESLAFSTGKVSAAEFKQLVEVAVQRINSGQIEKIVLSRDIVAELLESFDNRAALKDLAQSYPTCWVYSVDGMFGASPELLVRVSHSQVSARVLAGTAARGTDPAVDQAIAAALATSSKNTNEHAFAVNSLVASLAPFCSHVDADPAPFSLALPNLWHLASDVHGVLNENSSVLDLAAALHPTAAVAGTPTNLAKELILQLEQNDRGRYAGPIGWIGADGDGEWAIALRGAQIEKTSLRAFAGCGIVAESEPEAELAETELKFRPIREALS